MSRPSKLPAASSSLSGQSIGRYRLLNVLGSGAMGTVYRAFDTVLTRDVALKTLHVENAGSRHRFLQEARAMARISHVNVVEIFDVVRTERSDGKEQSLIAMELVEGRTLEAWLRVARHWTDIRDVFVQAGRGLVAAHEAGMIHRDFKPANVLVDERDRARVTDFGLTLTDEELAPTLDELGGDVDQEIDVSSPGMVVGTPAYMAPEQHRGARLTPASDQFAFCAALFEALFGERPFDGRSCRELSRQKHLGMVTPIRGRRDVPAWLRKVVLRGLQTEPRDRFASMSELLQALQGPTARRLRSPWTRWAAAAALVLGGAGLGLVTTSGQSTAGLASGSASAVVSVASLDSSSSAPSRRR